MTRIRAGSARILFFCAFAAFLLAVLTGCGQAGIPKREIKENAEANATFEREEYEQAISEYEKVSKEQPDRPEPDYNSANAQYRLEDYEKAEEELDRALMDAYSVEDEDLAASTLFNLGNVLFQMEEYEDAVESYKQVLRDDPDAIDAKHNLELALRQIEEQQQQEQQEQQQQPQRGQGDQPGPPDQPDDEGDDEQEGPEGQREGVGEDPEGEQRGDASDQETQQMERPGSNPEQQMTPGQALQFLEAVGQNTETLQGYLQRQFVPTSPAERDW